MNLNYPWKQAIWYMLNFSFHELRHELSEELTFFQKKKNQRCASNGIFWIKYNSLIMQLSNLLFWATDLVLHYVLAFVIKITFFLFFLGLPLQELLVSMGSLEFSGGKAEIAEVTRCSGDVSAFHIVSCQRWYLFLWASGDQFLGEFIQ